MAKPWWQYFAVRESEIFAGTEIQRIYGALAMILTLIIVSILLINMILKLRREQEYQGTQASKYYLLTLFGLYLTILNSTIIRISLYLTKARWVFLSRAKGALFLIGLILFIVGLVNVVFSIIDFSNIGRILIRLVYVLFLVVSITLFLFMVFNIIGVPNLNEIGIDNILAFVGIYEAGASTAVKTQALVNFAVTLTTISSALVVLLLLTFIVILIRETRTDPSRIERLRLVLISVAAFLLLVSIGFIGVGSSYKDAMNPAFAFITYIAIPSNYFFTYPLMYLMYQWSLFTPKWLMVKAGVIQPSFREYLSSQEGSTTG